MAKRGSDLLPHNAPGYVWKLGSRFSTGKKMTYGQYLKTGSGFSWGGQDGPQIEIKGVVYDYCDDFIHKTYRGEEYVFYTVQVYVNGSRRYILPGTRTGRGYKDWKESGIVRFY